MLGAVPFPADVLRLKELGVSGVVTLNESYETLVPTSLYHVSIYFGFIVPLVVAASIYEIAKSCRRLPLEAFSSNQTVCCLLILLCLTTSSKLGTHPNCLFIHKPT